MNLRQCALTAVAAISIVATGCSAGAATANQSFASSPPVSADIINEKGVRIGTARLTQLNKGVQVHITASGLKAGLHGVHIHETGKCEMPDFKSSGGHFNPMGTKHGYGSSQGQHAGDMPNLAAGTDGKVEAQFILTDATLQKAVPASLLKDGGTALIIHEGPDDMQTDPSGNSGSRIACAVIN